MSKKDLGCVALFPWVDLYEFFTEKPTNFTGKGGYKLYGGKAFIMLNGKAISNITFPAPESQFDLSISKNGKNITVPFNGSVALSPGDNIEIAAVYKVKGGGGINPPLMEG